MISIICGSNRPNSNSLKISKIVYNKLKENKVDAKIIDLALLPQEVFNPINYGNTSPAIKKHQDDLVNAEGIITVIPEYNGSYPGVLKYFIDLLELPTIFRKKPIAFIGVSAGQFGGLTPVSHMQNVFGYCESHIFGQKVYFPRVHKLLSEDGASINDGFILDLLDAMLINFTDFVRRLKS